jgi:hypothetical protein
MTTRDGSKRSHGGVKAGLLLWLLGAPLLIVFVGWAAC